MGVLVAMVPCEMGGGSENILWGTLYILLKVCRCNEGDTQMAKFDGCLTESHGPMDNFSSSPTVH